MKALAVAVADGIATLTIDQPDSKVNVLSRTLWTELEQTLLELGRRSDLIGLAIVSGKPGIFVAGADLKELADVPGPDHGPTRQFIEQGSRVLDALESLPYATVACVDGAALGGGLELALACDYRLAATNPKTKFGLPEVTLGLIPGWGGTQRLPRIIGPTSTIETLLQNLQLDAESARFRGLVCRVAPSERLAAEGAAVLRAAASSASWRRQRERKNKPLDLACSELTILEMTAGTLSEAKLNTMSLSPEALQAFRDQARSQLPPLTQPAALAALDVIAAGCLLPLPEALRLETDLFVRLAGSPEARKLITDFFSSRKRQ